MKKTDLKRLEKTKWVTHCYIRKGAYYRPDASGYTDYITKAGIFPKDVAIQLATNYKELQLIPVEVGPHNKFILDEVKDLLSRILTPANPKD